MNEDEVNKAIEKGKLPLAILDYILLGLEIFFISFIVSILIICYKIPDFENFTEMFCCMTFVILITILMSWKVCFYDKELTIYSSNLSIDKKRVVLEKLASDSDVKLAQRKNNCYWLDMFSDEHWGAYSVTIIYNESAYGITSLDGVGVSAILSSDISKEIISKIQKFETSQ